MKSIFRAGNLFASLLALVFTAAVTGSCADQEDIDKGDDTREGRDGVRLELSLPGYSCRAADPDDRLVSDLNILVFDTGGALEQWEWIGASELRYKDGRYCCRLDLLAGKAYDIFVMANLGYRPVIGNLEEMEAFRYTLSYPDEYTRGIPMCACKRGISLGKGEERLEMELERLMARVRLVVDRSRLSEDIDFQVRRVSVEACPRSVQVFGDSRVRNADELFGKGFTQGEDRCLVLNSKGANGLSAYLDLYLLENLQGERLNDMCSYIEMEADYRSGELYTDPGRSLRYRFYLGDAKKDFNVCRNCQYTVTVTPCGDGLGGSGNGSGDGSRGEDWWRIDKSDLKKFVSSVSLSSHRLDFSYVGEEHWLSARVEPEDAGNKTLEWSSSNNNVAVVDSDGKVCAKGNGSCSISCWSTDGSEVHDICEVNVNVKPAWVKFCPSGYIEVDVGDRLRVWSEYFPPNMSCRIDKDDLEFDCSRGIYDYELSEDGSSVELTIRGEGSGMFRFEVGEPLDTSALVYIHVRPLSE